MRWRHSLLPLNRVASACKFISCSATVLVFVAFFNRKCRRSDSVSPPNNCEMPFVLCIPLRSDVYVASLLFFYCSFLRTFFGLLSWFLLFLMINYISVYQQLYSCKIWWDLVGNLVTVERVSNRDVPILSLLSPEPLPIFTKNPEPIFVLCPNNSAAPDFNSIAVFFAHHFQKDPSSR